MTTNETMQDEIFYDSSDAWTAARHKNVVRYIRADTVSAAVRDAVSLIEQSELDLSYYVHLATKVKTNNKWIKCEVYKIEMSIDRLRKALAALRGLGETK